MKAHSTHKLTAALKAKGANTVEMLQNPDVRGLHLNALVNMTSGDKEGAITALATIAHTLTDGPRGLERATNWLANVGQVNPEMVGLFACALMQGCLTLADEIKRDADGSGETTPESDTPAVRDAE